MPVILTSGELKFEPTWANSLRDPISKKPFTKKKGLVEWLKVKVLSSSPNNGRKKKKTHSGYWKE
jgi:hypothetical protein